MTFASAILKSLDRIRSIPGRLGVRPYAVFAVVTSSTGANRKGGGTDTETETSLTVANGYPPKVRQLSQAEVIASGGLYSAQDLRIGPLTPPYADGGTDVSDLDPNQAAKQYVKFRLTGPGLFESGEYYIKVGQAIDSALSYSIIVRKTGT